MGWSGCRAARRPHRDERRGESHTPLPVRCSSGCQRLIILAEATDNAHSHLGEVSKTVRRPHSALRRRMAPGTDGRVCLAPGVEHGVCSPHANSREEPGDYGDGDLALHEVTEKAVPSPLPSPGGKQHGPAPPPVGSFVRRGGGKCTNGTGTINLKRVRGGGAPEGNGSFYDRV